MEADDVMVEIREIGGGSFLRQSTFTVSIVTVRGRYQVKWFKSHEAAARAAHRLAIILKAHA